MGAAVRQDDMFGMLMDEPAPAGVDFADRPRVKTRAWSYDGLVTLYNDREPKPFEIVVRGVPCVVSFHGGPATHAITPPGTPFWSDTGYRSFMGGLTEPDDIVAMIEAFIDAPSRDGNGCGGKLKPWWPSCVLDVQQRRAYLAKHGIDRFSDDYVANNRRWHDEAVAKVIAMGFDPDVVAPWPKGRRVL